MIDIQELIGIISEYSILNMELDESTALLELGVIDSFGILMILADIKSKFDIEIEITDNINEIFKNPMSILREIDKLR